MKFFNIFTHVFDTPTTHLTEGGGGGVPPSNWGGGARCWPPPNLGLNCLRALEKIYLQVFKFIQKKLKKPTREQNIREKRGESMYDEL